MLAGEFVRQSDLEVPRELSLIRPRALILTPLDGVPQLFAINGPFRGMFRRENAAPLRFAEIAVVLNLVATLIDKLLAGVVGGARDGALPFAPRYDADLEAIESRTNTLLAMALPNENARRAKRSAGHWAKPNV